MMRLMGVTTAAALVALTAGEGTAVARAAETADGPPALEEIVVTAQKRTEDLQQVPLSVSVMNGDDMRGLAVSGDDIRVLSGRVANVNAESTFGRVYPRFYIRGLGNEDFTLNASQPVALYYDDVVLENPVLKGMPAFDLERVEVLRGPQGTLWGKNTTAGAVHLVSRKPTDATEGYADITYGNFSSYTAESAVGGSLGDGLTARASVLYQHRDPWVRNEVTGNKLDGYDDLAARVQVQWKPGERFTALVQAFGRSLDGTSTLFHGAGSDATVGVLPFDKYDIAEESDNNNRQKVTTRGVTLNAAYEFDDVTLTSITAWLTGSMFSVGDVDGSPRPALINTSDVDGLTQVTQELRLASNPGGPFGWQGGLYYFSEDLDYWNTTANNTFQTADGMPGFGAYQRARQRSHSGAAFGQANYALTERLTLTAGLRYTVDAVDFWQDSSSFTPKPTDLAAFPNFATDPFYKVAGRGPGPWFLPRFSSTDGRWGKFTYDGSVAYRLDDQVNLYARIAEGYHAGVITGQAIFDPLQKADPETVTSYEAGVKGDFFGRRLRTDLSVFHYVYRNQQLVAYSTLAAGQEIIRLINAKGGIGTGFELESKLQVTDGLLLGANLGFVKTEIQGPTELDDPRNPGHPLDIAGQPFPFAPQWTASLTADYTYPLGGGRELFLGTDWTYRGDENFQLTSFVQPQFRGQGYWEGGARAGYRFGRTQIAAWVRNITDASVLTSAVNVNGYAGVFTNPRTYGVELSTHF
ncbi:TonB-dependent receptor [Nitrospirillum sp. BR 11164]|uniref:TonB-dependent receptor n=1 Tax=Nitrospirillum sp. BR 11164 TaxID=3104324 RepID=UPI002B0001CF|nr:TonB-dependent receptor [Nitrospirillum sp. BR 11164]MEA1648017.1 TonB-dependent receptor [Nitrospirillum sp. BR 11164]